MVDESERHGPLEDYNFAQTLSTRFMLVVFYGIKRTSRLVVYSLLYSQYFFNPRTRMAVFTAVDRESSSMNE